MSKKERIEDLGRLSVMIDNIWDHDLFKCAVWARPKDAVDCFANLNLQAQQDFIHEIAYLMENLRGKIGDCSIIASGLEDEMTGL